MCGSGRAGHRAGTGIAYESRPVILGKVDAQQITGAAIISRYGMAQMHGHDLTQQSILFRTVQQSTGLACTENPSSRITRLPNASAATRPDTAITACVPP